MAHTVHNSTGAAAAWNRSIKHHAHYKQRRKKENVLLPVATRVRPTNRRCNKKRKQKTNCFLSLSFTLSLSLSLSRDSNVHIYIYIYVFLFLPFLSRASLLRPISKIDRWVSSKENNDRGNLCYYCCCLLSRCCSDETTDR